MTETSTTSSFHELSYIRHQSHHREANNHKLAETWARKDTVDAWRHRRMYENVDALIECYPNARWLTIGDGRYGTDANYLRDHGCDVLATDLDTHYLEQAQSHGFIDTYSKQNAEALSFEDESFDFVLCKESYHHFPRPHVAVYEMLRVARQGVIIMEPNDHEIIDHELVENIPPLLNLRRAVAALKRKVLGQSSISILGHQSIVPVYEPVGNYVYSISRREIEKLCLGLNLPAYAFKYFNDVYIDGVEYEKADDENSLFREVCQRLNAMDSSANQSLTSFNYLCVVLCKQQFSDACREACHKRGLTYQELARNPYIQS